MSGGESVDRLRQAAARMRALAEANEPEEFAWWDVAALDCYTPQQFTAEHKAHIAAWSPDVALAVADWLDFVVAARVAIDFVAARDPERGLSSDGSECFKDMEKHALAVAAAFLGSL